MTTEAAPSTSSPRTPTWLRLAGWQAAGHAYVFAGFLAVAVLAASAILALIARTGTTPTMSALQFAQQVAPWIPFAVSIHFATSWLGPHIAAGMTRRSFVRAAVTAVLAHAVAGSLALLLALRAEDWVFDRLGWRAYYDFGRAAPADSATLPYLWGLFLLLAIGGITGLLVGLTYFRLGSAATVLLPATLAPLAASVLALDPTTMFAPFVFRTDGVPWRPPDLGLGGELASVVIGCVILALTALAVHLLARRVSVRSTRA